MRRRLSTILAVTGLACGVTAVALAKPSVTGQAGSWTIGPIAGSDKHCSMKNTYDGGHTLVFARDTSGVNSVAVDFGRDSLQAGHQYPVTLDVPPVLTREMTAVAATKQVLLVNMGRDAAFYDALGRMDALYVTAQGQDYSYSLHGTTDALRELGECAAALSGGKAYAAVPATPRAKVPVAEEGGGLKDEVRKLRAENKVLARQNASLKSETIAAEVRKDDVETARRAAEEISARQKQMEAENAALRESLKGMQDKLEKQAALIGTVRDEQRQKQETVAAENARLKADLAALRKAMETKDERIAREQAERGRKQETASAENARLKADLAALREKLDAQSARAGEDRLAEAENVKLKQDLAAARRELERRQAAAVPPPPVRAETRREAPKKAAAAEKMEDTLAKILSVSGVAGGGGLTAVQSPGGRAYRWESGGLYGSAEETRSVKDFGGQVDAYFGRMARLCKGDFARTAASTEKVNGVTVQKAEMACIDDENDAAAALLFVGDGKSFTVVTQEGSTEQMPAAISRRNAVASAVASN